MHNIGVQIYLFFSKQENKTPYFYVLLLLVRLSTNPFVQFLIERMCGHRGSRSKYDELHAGTGDGYIHATQVAQETDLLAVVVAYERDDDYVALLSLETVDVFTLMARRYGRKNSLCRIILCSSCTCAR